MNYMQLDCILREKNSFAVTVTFPPQSFMICLQSCTIQVSQSSRRVSQSNPQVSQSKLQNPSCKFHNPSAKFHNPTLTDLALRCEAAVQEPNLRHHFGAEGEPLIPEETYVTSPHVTTWVIVSAESNLMLSFHDILWPKCCQNGSRP